jgi:hypothetical protein
MHATVETRLRFTCDGAFSALEFRGPCSVQTPDAPQYPKVSYTGEISIAPAWFLAQAADNQMLEGAKIEATKTSSSRMTLDNLLGRLARNAGVLCLGK